MQEILSLRLTLLCLLFGGVLNMRNDTSFKEISRNILIRMEEA